MLIQPSFVAAIRQMKCAFTLLTRCVSPPFASQSSPRDQLSKCGHNRIDVARFTFDLYKNNPKDFIGCLNVKATFYGAYSVSYDLRCYAAKKLLK